jgi:hypothetical protein
VLRSLLAAAAAALSLCGAAARAESEPRVTVFGDSVLMAVEWNDEPLRILEQGVDVQLDVAVCRRLVDQSCPFDGTRAPTLVDAAANGVAPNVVVEVGYNDDPRTFASSVEQALTSLHRAGARQIRWLTLRETKRQYAQMNAVLRHAAATDPALTLVDWNAYSGNHPEWFQSDGEHLDYGGAVAMASIINASLLAPPRVETGSITLPAPPPARARRIYTARLQAEGGVPPYSYRVVAGRPPRGIHLLADGRLYGRPRWTGMVRLTLQVRDSLATTVLCPLTFRVR